MAKAIHPTDKQTFKSDSETCFCEMKTKRRVRGNKKLKSPIKPISAHICK